MALGYLSSRLDIDIIHSASAFRCMNSFVRTIFRNFSLYSPSLSLSLASSRDVLQGRRSIF